MECFDGGSPKHNQLGGLLPFFKCAKNTVRYPHDIKGLASLRDALGDHFVRGVVVYTGQEVIPMSDRIFAVPVGMMFAGA